MGQKDIDAWSAIWAENSRILVFYPPRGFATSLDGKGQIVEGFRELSRHFETFRSELTAVYPALDSDTVCVEYKVQAKLLHGLEYTNSNIAVFQFQDGRIGAYHDYFDPRRFQRVVDPRRCRARTSRAPSRA